MVGNLINFLGIFFFSLFFPLVPFSYWIECKYNKNIAKNHQEDGYLPYTELKWHKYTHRTSVKRIVRKYYRLQRKARKQENKRRISIHSINPNCLFPNKRINIIKTSIEPSRCYDVIIIIFFSHFTLNFFFLHSISFILVCRLPFTMDYRLKNFPSSCISTTDSSSMEY